MEASDPPPEWQYRNLDGTLGAIAQVGDIVQASGRIGRVVQLRPYPDDPPVTVMEQGLPTVSTLLTTCRARDIVVEYEQPTFWHGISDHCLLEAGQRKRDRLTIMVQEPCFACSCTLVTRRPSGLPNPR